MKKISSKESEIANILNSKRDRAFIDIYKENDFNGLGILIDDELNIYKYIWEIAFNKKENSFLSNNSLYEIKGNITYDDIEMYLLHDLNIIEKKYENDSDDEIRTTEIIRLNSYEGEFESSELYAKIKEKINDIVEEDL